jgi:hypothetical protein
MYLRLLVTSFVTAAILSSFASGQGRGVGGFAHPPAVTPGFAGFDLTTTTGFRPAFPRRPLGNAPVIFFSDLGYEPASSQPVSVVVIQPSALAVAPREEEAHPPAKPLLLELQGDRWVRVEQFQMTSNVVSPRDGKAARRVENAPVDTLLVFRNGRSETTSAYAVIGDILYEQSNYWISGSWTKKIPIADLDLPATIEANQQRGVMFKLPAGPNEVILQP